MQIETWKRPLGDGAFCGDAAEYWRREDETVLLIVDGLGHGKQAEIAARAAVHYVASHLGEPLPDLFARCSEAIRYTRGAAMGVARIQERTGEMAYAGVGNTRAMLVGERNVRFSNTNGIVGAGYDRIWLEKSLVEPGELVLLFTDGLKEFIDMSLYEHLFKGALGVLADRIAREWSLERDDAALLVYRRE